MTRISYILYIILAGTFFSQSQNLAWEQATRQEVTSAYLQACKWFVQTPSYAFKMKYASFRDHVATEPIESSSGYYKRVSNNYVTEAVGIKTIQNNTMKVVVDTADKLITVMSPGNLNPKMASPEEIEELLNNARSLKKAKHLKQTRYRMDFNKNDQYVAYEFCVNEKGLLEGITCFFSDQVEKSSAPGEKDVIMRPRMEISFFGYQMPAKYEEAEFSENSILVRNKANLNLTDRYKAYRLLDYRVPAKK